MTSTATRALLLWALCAMLLALWAGPNRFGWSENQHFRYLAQDLHAGRWTHDGPPPGYCGPAQRKEGSCRYHRFDDWARGHKLRLDPALAASLGTDQEIWATPCQTPRCKKDRNWAQHRYWIPAKGLQQLPADQYQAVERRWFISFPAGPALIYLVSLWLGLPLIPDIPLTWILAATIPVSLDLALRRRQDPQAPQPKHNFLWLALATLFATPLWSIAVQGQVWFLAQICFAALLSGGLALFLQQGRLPKILGSILWAWALWCRPSASLGLLAALGIFYWRHSAKTLAHRKEAWCYLTAPLLALLGMAWFNHHRFGDIAEFGHHFLYIRWQENIQRFGLLDLHYLGRNLQSFLWQTPQLSWPPKLSIHGLGWIWSTPWILWRSFSKGKDPWLLACALLIFAPALLYQNTGQTQVSYRFALDALPMWILALGPIQTIQTRVFRGLLITAALLNALLAWLWVRNPAALFVHDPPGWPF